ncbi:MAG TPA: protein containing YHS domain protein, partial [Candidatus Polarisedimenticolia bacterium]|nr:protein containing YHS domain protein [Candidatus Polarisedimenticolia bacterium]
MRNKVEEKERRLRITVGVMGSAGGSLGQEVVDRAVEMGRVIAERGCVLVTGACPGLPHYAVKGAKAANGIVIGISPALNFEEHAMKYHSPYEGY